MIVFIVIVFVLVSVIYWFSTRNYGYWKTKNVPHLKPTPLLGNFSDYFLRKMSLLEVESKMCQHFEDEPLVGSYFATKPCLIVKDPEFIKLVTTKDFYYFNARQSSAVFDKDTLTKNLFNAHGDVWKVLRQNLTPVFSSAKMKKMFYLIEECSKTFETLLDRETAYSNTVEIRNLIGQFTMDCIGTCAFGINTKAMDDKKKENPFTNMINSILNPSVIVFSISNIRLLWPGLFKLLGLNILLKKATSFFTNLLREVFASRKGKPSTRHDFVDLILSFNNNKHVIGDRMRNLKTGGKEQFSLEVTDDLLIAQCFLFLAAGFETSATTTSYTLYELAKHPDIQEQVREEIDKFLENHDGVVTYDCLVKLPFTEQCVDEAMRLYPVLGVINREVTECYNFPNKNLTLDAGVVIHLPVFHIQRNPKYFPNPEEFRPERFSPENKKNIVPYTYFPFGEGPRICIGMRFAKMQMAAALVTVLKKYHVTLHEDTPTKLEFEPMSIITQPKQPIKLRFIPRTDRDPVLFNKNLDL